VREVVQSLVDERLVDTEKIGSSVYYWAFPSKAAHSVNFLSFFLTFLPFFFSFSKIK